MATATPEAAVASYALAQQYRLQQNRLAALVAYLVATYYRQNVVLEDPASVAKWLDIMVPRIMQGSNRTGGLAAPYASATRALELPGAPRLTFPPVKGSVEEQIRTSLAVVGPTDWANKMKVIETLDVPAVQREALIRDAKDQTAKVVQSAAVRHVQSGGRNTILAATQEDHLALGYVRVTKDKPCYFCAMLASRGKVFAADSFADSDPRFVGDGTAKVHDNCNCSMKPVYLQKGDKALEATAVYTDMWERWGAGGGTTQAVLRFRRGYDEWLKTGQFLDWDVVNDRAAFLARNAA